MNAVLLPVELTVGGGVGAVSPSLRFPLTRPPSRLPPQNPSLSLNVRLSVAPLASSVAVCRNFLSRLEGRHHMRLKVKGPLESYACGVEGGSSGWGRSGGVTWKKRG